MSPTSGHKEDGEVINKVDENQDDTVKVTDVANFKFSFSLAHKPTYHTAYYKRLGPDQLVGHASPGDATPYAVSQP